MGEIGILNVGAGDTKLVFDPSDPEGMKRAARIVTDMIRKGFVILAQVGTHEWNGKQEPIYRRVKHFDEKTSEYIVADDQPEEHDGRSEAKATGAVNKRGDGRGMHRTKRIPAGATRGVAVSRTSGG